MRSAINRSAKSLKAFIKSGSQTGTAPAGSWVDIIHDSYTFAPDINMNAAADSQLIANDEGGGADGMAPHTVLRNTGGTNRDYVAVWNYIDF